MVETACGRFGRTLLFYFPRLLCELAFNYTTIPSKESDTTVAITKTLPLADSAGMIASIACAIHCAAMPLVISYLPLLGLEWLSDESFHQVMAVVCFGFALSAFIPGWKKHGSLAPTCVGLVGIVLLSGAAFGLEGSCCATYAATDETNSQEQTCVDEACQHCVRSGALPDSFQEPTGGLATRIFPLITPLGGCLLVCGHLVNHRKSCECNAGRCCLDLG